MCAMPLISTPMSRPPSEYQPQMNTDEHGSAAMKIVPLSSLYTRAAGQPIHDDSQQHGDAEDEPIGECAAGNLRQRVAQDAEDERAQHRAHHRGAASGKR